MEEKAKELKEKGNGLYKQMKFEDALLCYSEAAALQPQDPVYQSNISAVQFELGNYDECVKISDNALSLLSPSSSSSSSNPSLSSRLLLRKAKALFYSNKVKESEEILSSLSSFCKENNIAGLDAGMLEKVSQITSSSPSSSSVVPKLSIFRSCADTRTPEYYIVGHDKINSAFNGTITNEQHDQLREVSKKQFSTLLKQFNEEAPYRIHLSNKNNNNNNNNNNEKEQNEYAFLFGGIGDARHLYASLLDLETCEYPTTKHFHFTMVDVKGVVVARDLVVVYILLDLAKFSREEMNTEIEAIELLALLNYTFLGTVMPGYLYDKLMKFIGKLKQDIEKETLPNWIVLDTQSVSSVLPYLDDWLDFKVDTITMLKKTNGEKANAMNAALFDEVKNTNIPMPFEDPSILVKSYMEKMSDEELMEMLIPGKTVAEKREALNAFLNSTDMKSIARDSMMQSMKGLENEHNTYRTVNALFPPSALLDRHPEIRDMEKAVFAEDRVARQKLKSNKKLQEFQKKHGMKDDPDDKSDDEDEDEDEDEVEEKKDENGEKVDLTERRMTNTHTAMEHIAKTFKPNPTVWDKWWIEVIGEDEYEFNFNPFDAASNICDDLLPLPVKPTRIFDYMAPFFARVATSLKNFSTGQTTTGDVITSNVVLEWIVGDVYSACADMVNYKDSRIQRKLAVEYDRIFLSNIPDYTGGNLPIAIFCAPVLKSIPHAYVSYNILLNTGVFKNYEECVRTYTLLPTIQDSKKYMALNHFHGDLWGEDPKWSVLSHPLPLSQLPSQDEATHWLYRLFLYFVLPPQRNAMVKFRVDHPLNLLAYVNKLKLLKWLAQVGFPKHWLVTVLDSLLSGSIKTKARPPPNSMNFHYSPATISTKPFVAELELALSLSSSNLPFRPLTFIPSFSSFKRLSFKTQFIQTNDLRSSVVSLFLVPEKDASARKLSTSPYQKLREDIVNGDPNSYLISLLHWDSFKNRMQFWVEEKRLEKMVADDCLIFPVRLDNYTTLAKAVPLKKVLEKKVSKK